MLEVIVSLLSNSNAMTISTYLFSQDIHLLRLESRIRKHTNLARDMTPIVLGAQLLEILFQQRTHFDNAVGHALDFTEPLLVELIVV